MAELVSKSYADALFDLGIEMEKVEFFKKEFSFLIDVFENYSEFLILFNSPQIYGNEKKEIIQKVFSESISVEMVNFLKILIDKNRTSSIQKIYHKYVERVDTYKRETTAYVKTVIPMSELQQSKLALELQQLTGKKVTIENTIDLQIVGGVMIKMGDQVLDGSIRRKLYDITESLKHVRV